MTIPSKTLEMIRDDWRFIRDFGDDYTLNPTRFPLKTSPKAGEDFFRTLEMRFGLHKSTEQ